MRIIELRVRDVLRIKTAVVRPGGGVVRVTGKNGAGKTSLLECIRMLLAGNKSVPKQPIRHGAENGEIVGDIGTYYLKRTFTESDSYLSLEEKSGKKVSRPQEVLSGLYSSLAFDPLEFSRMPAKEQASTLMEVAGLDFTEPDAVRKNMYEQRTEVNRELEREKATAARLGKVWPDGLATEEVSAAQLAETIRAMQNSRATYQAKEQTHADILAEVARLKSLLAKAEESAAEVGRWLADRAAPSQEDIDARIGELRQIDATNQLVRDRKAWMESSDRVVELEKKSRQITATIEAIDARKAQMLADSKIPVPGLTFDANGVYLAGVAFEQASQAEKIRVGVAIGLAQNPTLRVILIRDGSLLDSDSMAVLEQEATARNAQVWIERVEEQDAGGILVEDGVATDAEAVGPGRDAAAVAHTVADAASVVDRRAT